MILPTKHLTTGQSLLGVSALVLAMIDRPKTVNMLWEEARAERSVGTFDRFVLALDLLYLVGAVEFVSGRIRVSR